MEEKERYEWNSRFDEAIKDNQTGNIVNAVEVLNQQDKRIKELEQENKQLKQSQKQLAIEQLEKVEEILWNSQDIGNVIDNDKFLEKLNYLIKSLKGEE